MGTGRRERGWEGRERGIPINRGRTSARDVKGLGMTITASHQPDGTEKNMRIKTYIPFVLFSARGSLTHCPHTHPPHK